MALPPIFGATGAVASTASTVFSYFSPVKSPYYLIITVGTIALVATRWISAPSWALVFVPVFLVLFVSTVLALRSSSDFTAEDYNVQLRFARSTGISTAMSCLVYLGFQLPPESCQPAPGECSMIWYFWTGYTACILQLVIFLTYVFVYNNYNSFRSGRNFVQVTLILCVYLIGMTIVSVNFTDSHRASASLGALYILWLIGAVYISGYLVRNFRLMPPTDVDPPRTDEATAAHQKSLVAS